MTKIQNFCDFKVVSDAFPQTLKQLRRWILWRLEIRDGAQTKVPYRIDGLRASITNPNDWTDFETACRAFDPAKYNGLGFILKREDNIVCIDLDGCIGDDGQICDEAFNIVRILNSWTEVSQSGKGLHIFVRGTKPTDKCKVKPREFESLEVYDSDCYIALTGNHLPNTPLEIIDRQGNLNALLALYFPKLETIQEEPDFTREHHDAQLDSTATVDSHSLTELEGKPKVKCKKCDFTMDLIMQDGRPFMKCLRCGWHVAIPEAFTFANFDGDFRSFCLICNTTNLASLINIDGIFDFGEPTLVIDVDKNKQPVIKCLRCGFTFSAAEFEIKIELHPILMKNTKLLGQALRKMVRKALACAESLPASRSNLSPSTLLKLVLNDLRKKYACKMISGAEIRKTLNTICAAKANDVGHLLYPEHILRIGQTNFFVFRQNELRPLEYRGLVPDSNGVLPDTSAPF